MAAKVILVVDDAHSIRQAASQVLTAAGYGVILAREGQEALGKLDGTSVHMVITDIFMPVMDGFTLLRHLKDRPDTRYLPCIVMTSDNTDEIRAIARASGAKAWIAKPLDLARLADTVGKLLPP